MQLYIIRHAQSENNALWARTGSSDGRFSDPGITEIGHRQAEAVAEFLAGSKSDSDLETNRWDSHNFAGFDLTHLYSSYMLRAVQTGSYISEATGLPLMAWEHIHEWGGIFDQASQGEERNPLPGLNRPYFEENFPNFIVEDVLGEEGWWNHRPYEPPMDTLRRAARFLNDLLERHSGDDRVGIVTHGGFSDSMLKVLIGHWPIYSGFGESENGSSPAAELLTNAPDEMWFRLNNVSISRIDFHPKRFVVVYLNRIDFLPAELAT